MTETLVKPVISGWCLPGGADGTPHPTEHAKCAARLADGRLTRCDCPDHRGVSCRT